jgi:hypothetical protein
MPNTTGKIMWNLFIIILVLYTATVSPFRLAFVIIETDSLLENFFKGIDFIVDIGFAIDIFINFLSAYEKSDGRYEYNLKSIAINYLTTFFIIDFLATLPIDIILGGFDSE